MSGKPTNKLFALLAAVALLGSVVVAGVVIAQQSSAGNQTEDVDQNTVFLRAAHASPDAGPVDVYVDGETVLTNVSFGNVSDYLALTGGSHQVAITETGDPEAVVFEGNITLEPRTATTLAATGEVASSVGDNATTSFEAELYSDDAYRPPENASAIRIIHLSPDASAVDVTIEGSDTVLADNLSFREASDYVNVPAGNYTVEIREETPTNNGTTITTVDVSLEGGTVYSGLALGYVDPGDDSAAPSLEVEVIEDAAFTVHLPVEEPPATETPPTETEATPDETATPSNETMTPPTETEAA